MADCSVAEAQWSSFCSNVIADWSGSWTFWDPSTGTVRRCFDCVRSFKALNVEKTIVLHQNIRKDQPQRPGQGGPWKIHKEDTDDKGFCHPAFPKARAVLHANGGGVLTFWKLTDSDLHVFEIYLCRGEHRCSVIVSYDESKQLGSFGAIREKQANAQIEIWSSSKELREGFPHCDFNKDFIGVEKTFDDKLQLSVVPDCKWDKDYWMEAKEMDDSENLCFKFLPDTICLSFPSQLTSNPFSVRACVLFSNGDEKELQELTLTFVDGNLTSVKQGLYH